MVRLVALLFSYELHYLVSLRQGHSVILKSGLPGVSSWQQLIYLLCSKRKVNDKSKNSYIAFYLPNIIIPLAVGLIIYTLLNPFSFISICIYH